MSLQQAKKNFEKIEEATNELVSYFEEITQVAGGLSIEELAEWKLLFKRTREHFKTYKSKFGGFNQKLDFPFVDKMIDEQRENIEVDGTRLYPGMTGFFDVEKGNDIPEEFQKVEVDKTKLKKHCEKLLESGKPLPTWVKKHLQPEVRTRKMSNRNGG